MNPTPFKLAQLSHAIYDPLGEFDQLWTIKGVVIALAKVDDVDVLVLRGSATAEDWMRDAGAFPQWHSDIGFCHAGFLIGMDEVFATVRAVVGPKVVITGHSLGGARARILAALFVVNKVPVQMVCVFGSPKPGFANIGRVLAKGGVEHLSHRNRNDVVPLTPGVLPFWQHTEDWIAVDAAPAVSNLEPLRDHSSELYVKALSGSATPA